MGCECIAEDNIADQGLKYFEDVVSQPRSSAINVFDGEFCLVGPYDPALMRQAIP